MAERSNSLRASERARKKARRYPARALGPTVRPGTSSNDETHLHQGRPAAAGVLPDAPRARLVPRRSRTAEEWTAEDAAFMAGWEQSDESDDVSDGEPCPFCGGLGHGVDDCPMRRDAKGNVGEQRPDPVARLVDVVADAVLDTADENLSNFLAQLAANGLRAQRYNDLVAALVPGICADAAFDPEMLASKFEVDPEGLLLLRETVRREVDKLRAARAAQRRPHG